MHLSYSTASSALNAMALVSLEDVVKKKVPDISDADAAKLCKIIGELSSFTPSFPFLRAKINLHLSFPLICRFNLAPLNLPLIGDLQPTNLYPRKGLYGPFLNRPKPL